MAEPERGRQLVRSLVKAVFPSSCHIDPIDVTGSLFDSHASFNVA